MNTERTPGELVIHVSCGSLGEADAVEEFLRDRVDVNLGDRTAANLEIGTIQQQIDTLESEVAAMTARNDPKFAFAIKDRQQYIADLAAQIRLVTRRADTPVVTARLT